MGFFPRLVSTKKIGQFQGLCENLPEGILGVGQNLLLSILMGWTSIYQLFWGSLGARVLTNSISSTNQQVFISMFDRKKTMGMNQRKPT